MDYSRRPELESQTDGAADTAKPRLKPGPKKKDVTRSEKLSCRLTAEEKAQGEKYCKAHGLNEAKLLRASYLAATAQAPDARIADIAEAIARHLDDPGMTMAGKEKAFLRFRIREILKRFALFSLLVGLGCLLASGPTVAKYVVHIYEVGKTFVYYPGTMFIYHKGDDGFEIIRGNDK